MASRTIRFKLYALLSLPIVALVALWAFVTGYVVGDFFELRQASTLYEQVAAPATALAIEVRHERRVSAIQLSSAAEQTDGLPEARGQTDKAVADFIRHTTSLETTSVLDPALGAAISEVSLQAEKLRTIRGTSTGARSTVSRRSRRSATSPTRSTGSRTRSSPSRRSGSTSRPSGSSGSPTRRTCSPGRTR